MPTGRNPQQRAITHATPTQLAASQFAEGSMAPKVRAACQYVEQTAGFEAIGSIYDTARLLQHRRHPGHTHRPR
jgi:carbamate kinase